MSNVLTQNVSLFSTVTSCEYFDLSAGLGGGMGVWGWGGGGVFVQDVGAHFSQSYFFQLRKY